jgi:hypothetical protein
MIVLLSLLFAAFLFGIWLGLCFYRRTSAKATANTDTRFTVQRR